MKNNYHCNEYDACFRCEYAKFWSLLRGSVPMRCKAQCFLKYTRIPRIAAVYGANIINRNLIQFLYVDNNGLEELPHENLQTSARTDFREASC